MLNEYIIDEKFEDNKIDGQRAIAKLKIIGHDSLFYFALFLSAFILLQLFPLVTGLLMGINIGINEVIVSALGFTNVFVYKVYNKLLKNEC